MIVIEQHGDTKKYRIRRETGNNSLFLNCIVLNNEELKHLYFDIKNEILKGE